MKAVISSFAFIEDRFAWQVGDGFFLRVGMNFWVESQLDHRWFPKFSELVHALGRNIFSHFVDHAYGIYGVGSCFRLQYIPSFC